jgi:hypothetical protein
MDSIAKATRQSGLPPRRVTVAGEITAIGSITSCAAITQADISAVASLL